MIRAAAWRPPAQTAPPRPVPPRPAAHPLGGAQSRGAGTTGEARAASLEEDPTGPGTGDAGWGFAAVSPQGRGTKHAWGGR